MQESKQIAESSNQQQTLIAMIEQDERCAWFYIWPSAAFRGQFAVRACWLRNLQPAPLHEERDAMARGIAPRLSAEYCRTLDAEPPLDPAGIQIIWEPADDGAAVWYQGQLLGVIPGWSLYQQEQVSFSAGCIKASRLTAPLGAASTNRYYALAEHHRQLWRSWQEGDPWSTFRQTLLSCYQTTYGEAVHYYAVDQGGWPPMAISQHYHQGSWFFFTLGMSLRPMPWVEFLFTQQASHFRRVELAMAIDAEIMREEDAVRMASMLAECARLPWTQLSWLGEGHRIASPVAPQGFDGFIFSRSHESLVPVPELPAQQDDQVSLLWAIPLTQTEREFAEQNEQGDTQLLNLLKQQGHGPVFRPRASVVELPAS